MDILFSEKSLAVDKKNLLTCSFFFFKFVWECLFVFFGLHIEAEESWELVFGLLINWNPDQMKVAAPNKDEPNVPSSSFKTLHMENRIKIS